MGPSPESLWVQSTPACRRLTATPELSAMGGDRSMPVRSTSEGVRCWARAGWARPRKANRVVDRIAVLVLYPAACPAGRLGLHFCSNSPDREPPASEGEQKCKPRSEKHTA